MQEKILADLERSYDESRRTSGGCSFFLPDILGCAPRCNVLLFGHLIFAVHGGGLSSRRECWPNATRLGGYQTTFQLSQPRDARDIQNRRPNGIMCFSHTYNDSVLPSAAAWANRSHPTVASIEQVAWSRSFFRSGKVLQIRNNLHCIHYIYRDLP